MTLRCTLRPRFARGSTAPRKCPQPWSESERAPGHGSRPHAERVNEVHMPRLLITATNELSIELSPGNRFAIHPLWLRERCQDSKTIDLRTGQRLEDPSDFDL